MPADSGYLTRPAPSAQRSAESAPVIDVCLDPGWAPRFHAAGSEAEVSNLLVQFADAYSRAVLPVYHERLWAEHRQRFLELSTEWCRQSFDRGHHAGAKSAAKVTRSELQIPDLAKLLEAIAAAKPVPAVVPVMNIVNQVNPTPVNIENNVELPSRSVRATPQPNGSILLVPEPA